MAESSAERVGQALLLRVCSTRGFQRRVVWSTGTRRARGPRLTLVERSERVQHKITDSGHAEEGGGGTVWTVCGFMRQKKPVCGEGSQKAPMQWKG